MKNIYSLFAASLLSITGAQAFEAGFTLKSDAYSHLGTGNTGNTCVSFSDDSVLYTRLPSNGKVMLAVFPEDNGQGAVTIKGGFFVPQTKTSIIKLSPFQAPETNSMCGNTFISEVINGASTYYTSQIWLGDAGPKHQKELLLSGLKSVETLVELDFSSLNSNDVEKMLNDGIAKMNQKLNELQQNGLVAVAAGPISMGGTSACPGFDYMPDLFGSHSGTALINAVQKIEAEIKSGKIQSEGCMQAIKYSSYPAGFFKP